LGSGDLERFEAEAFYGGENIVRGLGPAEGFWIVVDRRFKFGRNIALDLAQEAQELTSAITWIATPDDLAGRRVQSREQGQGSMARIVVGAPLDLARAHGKQRLRSVQRWIWLFSSTQRTKACSGGDR